MIEVVEKARRFYKDAVTAEINQAELVEKMVLSLRLPRRRILKKKTDSRQNRRRQESKSEYGGQRTIDDIDRNWRSKSNCDHSISGRKGKFQNRKIDEYTGDQRRRF